MKMNIVALVLCLAHTIAASPVLANQYAQPISKGTFMQADSGLMATKPGGRGVKVGNATKNLKDQPDHHVNPDLKCGVTLQVTGNTDKYEDCPDTCPYFAQNRKDALHCTFVCVPPQECATWNPNKPIPDLIKNSKTCRGPRADFCDEPALDGTDTCITCQRFFALHIIDGQCYFQYWTALYILLAIVTVVFVAVMVWVVDFCLRKTINEAEVKRAQEFRSRSKILMEPDANGERRVYPIDTNLCKTDIAGPGMLLHFNFQAFIIFWSLVIAIVWTVLACYHNELFYLGTRRFGTPRHNCILVAWGYETQQRLMWTKVLFLAIVYVFSFISFLLFGVNQMRIYQQMDAEEKTMKDFAAELKGLPALDGDSGLEDRLKKVVQDATGLTVVGVSVAWDFGDDGQNGNEEKINKAMQDMQRDREVQLGVASPIPANNDPPDEMGSWHRKMYNYEKAVLGPDDDEPTKSEDIKTLLLELKTSDSAFVVFRTESDKMAAIEIAQNGGLKWDDSTLTLEELECEPATVNWQNFGDSSPATMTANFLKGFFTVYLPALAVWFFIFYVPYAASLYNFNYDNGAELPGIYSLVFTMVVVGGNATMYVVCDICCDIIGFRYKDTKQVCYMLFYLVACMINVLLDMVVTYYTALKIMVGLDFRTVTGQRVAEIDSFTEQFETYAMQRSLAENTYRYAFPSTFLIPFLIEPVITVLIPYQLGKKIIGTHREIYGTCTEAYIAAFDFDMGRYADILLNVFLGILIFYFPGGYTWSLFYGMFISHIVIYLFDHWRVINVIPAVKIVSRQVDWWAQVTLAACCAMIMSVLVFKGNCEEYLGYCYKSTPLIMWCSVAGIAHFVVHMLLLVYLVPVLANSDVEDQNPHMTYEDVAKKDGSTWFSVNPVHCLRSRYIHEHSPHCQFLSVGKEHLLQVNPKIGCHFQCKMLKGEDFSGYRVSDITDSLKAWILSVPYIFKGLGGSSSGKVA
jgi:hypothetical protein